MLKHQLHDHLTRLHRPTEVLIIGAGGTGSKLVAALRHLHAGLLALEQHGLAVTLADGDTVSEANLVRQAFYPSDVGLPKATVLINRLNLACGLNWHAHPHHLGAQDIPHFGTHLLISCVDSRAARAEIAQGQERYASPYSLDFGNTRSTGQWVLGCPQGALNPRKKDRLRTAFELFPELTDTSLPEDDTPSCSSLEALERQDLFINDLLVTSAVALLWQLLRYGEIEHHGAFVNLASGSVRPLPINPALWKRLSKQGQTA